MSKRVEAARSVVLEDDAPRAKVHRRAGTMRPKAGRLSRGEVGTGKTKAEREVTWR